jgi:hypothetical protein
MVESITVITLLLSALERIDLQAIFDRDPYESRRRALPGARLLKVLVVYQMIHTAKLRGLIRTLTEHPGLQKALVHLPRNSYTLLVVAQTNTLR